jgi:hypothetical protein
MLITLGGFFITIVNKWPTQKCALCSYLRNFFRQYYLIIIKKSQILKVQPDASLNLSTPQEIRMLENSQA